MNEKQYIPSSEKETWSSQVGHFSAVALGSSSHTKSITENSESENKDKPMVRGGRLNLNVKIKVQ